MNENQPLEAKFEGGQIVIRIGANVLAGAIAAGNGFHAYDEKRADYIRHFAITNPEQFARDVLSAMVREDEIGAYPLSELFDKCAQDAIDDGSTGVDHNALVKFGEKSAAENW